MVRESALKSMEGDWAAHYSTLRDAEQGARRESVQSFAGSKSRSSSPAASSSNTSDGAAARKLRDYGSVGHKELLHWLWLDFSAPVTSPVSKLVRRNIRQYSGQDLASMAAEEEESEAKRNEAVGFSRMVSQVLAPLGEGSLLASVFTLVSSAMGAGCLSLPFMIRRAGLVPGLLMLVLGAVLAHLSLVVLMSCARYTGSESMASLVELATGRKIGYVVDVVIAVYGIAAVLCYLIFIGDFFSGIVGSPLLNLGVSREALIIGISICVVWPLSLPRNLSALRYVCVLSVGAICVTAVAVAWKAPSYISSMGGQEQDVASEDWEIKMWSTDPFAILQSFSIAIFAFAAHTNAVPVANALRQADGSSIWRASLYSVVIELVFYVLMGLGGYLSFRGLTKQDFILNYRNDDFAMFVVRCIYGVVVCLGAPINLSPAASSILGLVSSRDRSAPQCKHCIVATTIVAGCVCVAVWNEQVADVIGLIGASFGSLIVLAWPAMIYKKVLFDLHPKRLAKFVFFSLVGAAAAGLTAFAVQVFQG